ncbi:hypothetical protein T4D_3892 [Trichinella pseudospiralis]|uniref:Uncharacterized protein n=1 Tax=Trichinella pseudospiralis TaxID=6337 RepID=A0A0V1DQ20_TRIPS|nr:hypothetical protein T4D_3892 [Trichinella pseudospiralis]
MRLRSFNNIANGFAYCSLLFHFFKLPHLHLKKREYKICMKASMASLFKQAF